MSAARAIDGGRDGSTEHNYRALALPREASPCSNQFEENVSNKSGSGGVDLLDLTLGFEETVLLRSCRRMVPKGKRTQTSATARHRIFGALQNLLIHSGMVFLTKGSFFFVLKLSQVLGRCDFDHF